MLAYCGRPSSARFCDPFAYIDPRYARETIAEPCSIWVALATAIISQTGSSAALSARLRRGGDGRQRCRREGGRVHRVRDDAVVRDRCRRRRLRWEGGRYYELVHAARSASRRTTHS